MPENRRKIQERLGRLYPGENSRKKYLEYCRLQKRLTTILALLGIGACICSSLLQMAGNKTTTTTSLQRREWGEGSYEVSLWAKVGEAKERIYYTVNPRQYSAEELKQLFIEVSDQLPEIIRGENESLLHVSNHLELLQQVRGYPFMITWKSNNHNLLGSNGRVHAEKVKKEGEEVVLTAIFSSQEESFCREYQIKIFPQSEIPWTEKLQELLTQYDEQSKQSDKMLLPEKLGKDVVIWQKDISWNGGYFLLLGLLGGVGVMWGTSRDLAEKDKQRQRELTTAYPEFVSSLQLYLGAGLSLRNTFFKMGEDYRMQKERGEKKQFLYEEVMLACNCLSNGIPESEVYRRWMERCDEIHYRKLGYLLISYERQGNEDILRQLGAEVYEAWEECRQRAARQGEEAGTKLLFPMILMLLVVMLLILLPVYMSF